jgi:hypothetical protein
MAAEDQSDLVDELSELRTQLRTAVAEIITAPVELMEDFESASVDVAADVVEPAPKKPCRRGRPAAQNVPTQPVVQFKTREQLENDIIRLAGITSGRMAHLLDIFDEISQKRQDILLQELGNKFARTPLKPKTGEDCSVDDIAAVQDKVKAMIAQYGFTPELQLRMGDYCRRRAWEKGSGQLADTMGDVELELQPEDRRVASALLQVMGKEVRKIKGNIVVHLKRSSQLPSVWDLHSTNAQSQMPSPEAKAMIGQVLSNYLVNSDCSHYRNPFYNTNGLLRRSLEEIAEELWAQRANNELMRQGPKGPWVCVKKFDMKRFDSSVSSEGHMGSYSASLASPVPAFTQFATPTDAETPTGDMH